MRRWIFNLIAVGCSLFALAVSILWAFSARHVDLGCYVALAEQTRLPRTAAPSADHRAKSCVVESSETTSVLEIWYHLLVRKRFFNVLVNLSLVLCIVSALAWVFSIGRFNSIAFGREEGPAPAFVSPQDKTTFWIYSSSGFLQIGFDVYRDHHVHRPGHWVWRFSHNKIDKLRSAWILSGWWKGNPGQPVWLVSTEFSYAFAVLIFAIPPIIRILALRRQQLRKRMNICQCGYDLRATPDRCPECGTVVIRK